MKRFIMLLIPIIILSLVGCNYFASNNVSDIETTVIENEMIQTPTIEVPKWLYPKIDIVLGSESKRIKPSEVTINESPNDLISLDNLESQVILFKTDESNLFIDTQSVIFDEGTVLDGNTQLFQSEIIDNSLPILESSKPLTYLLKGIYTDKANGIEASIIYKIQILKDIPVEVNLKKDTAPMGDVIVLTIDNLNPDESVEITSPFLAYNAKIFGFDQFMFTYLPIPYTTQSGEYDVIITVKKNDVVDRLIHKSIFVEAKTFDESRIYVSQETKSLKTADTLNELQIALDTARANPIEEIMIDGPFIQPVEGRISTEYGLMRFVNDKYESRHNGLDIAAPEGTTVLAAQNGVVVYKGPLTATGNTLIIDHGQNIFTIHYHLFKILVEVGDKVEKGNKVAEVGTTGFSTGPHLHWCIWINGAYVNPWQLIDQETGLIAKPESSLNE